MILSFRSSTESEDADSTLVNKSDPHSELGRREKRVMANVGRLGIMGFGGGQGQIIGT